MKRLRCVAALVVVLSIVGMGQQRTPPASQVQKSTPGEKITQPTATQQEPQTPTMPEERATEPRRERTETTAARPGEGEADEAKKDIRFDMREVAPVVTKHQITVDGKVLRYTATAGRLPIKEADGTIAAEMFFVAYTLDGADAGKRPLTFAFNGGPGSASMWLHMGALGPRRVVLHDEGFLPQAPYRLQDNQFTPLGKTDLVLVDAIGTGYSRPADMKKAKKFWSVKGDVGAFGEFIRMYLSRYERWSSPLYLLGESYGTTRAAGVSGYLTDKGITFNGVVLLSMILNFETHRFSRTNDVPFPLFLPTYTMIAGYHKKLPPELMSNMEQTKAEVEKWASTEYTLALNKGDALTPEERSALIEKLARYTGLKPYIIDQANLRIDVQTFTHHLLDDQKLRVGRLDGRYTGPDPQGFNETRFYDPTSANTGPPYTSVLNDYLRRELGYKVDMPYYASAGDVGPQFKWDWSIEGESGQGFPETASLLRVAMVKNPWLKVMVMEGYYDLATPFHAARYTMDHLDLPAQFRKNITWSYYEAGHMMYVRDTEAAKVKRDYEAFIDSAMKK